MGDKSSEELVPSENETDSSGEIKTDIESAEKKLPYPKSVFFIVSNEFCERFSYYGMKAVLTLYLKKVLGFDDDFATVIYHIFSMCCYFTPLFGAMIADSVLGKFRTIFYLSIVYCLGNIVLSLAATPPINLPAVPFSMIGLALIAIGTGGIKPCVAAFGGDQFKLPEQEVQLASFFSVFYFAINSGSLLSTILTPIFREDVKCFEQDNCFSLAFSVPAALMIAALIIFLIGKPLYIIKNPSGNVVIKLIRCITHALSNKGKRGEQEHWLDNAEGELYDKRFIEDVKIVLRVLVLYIPLPVFWALFDQQGSRWTLQATRMDGLVGGFTIKPDQVQVLNPALILIFIPLFDQVIYPLLAKCRLLTRPLQRLTTGGVLAGIAFVCSGIVELELEKTYPYELKWEEANLQFVNGLPCPINVRLDAEPVKVIPAYEPFIFEAIKSGAHHFSIDHDEQGACKGFDKVIERDIDIPNKEGFSVLIGAKADKKSLEVVIPAKPDAREKPEEGIPFLRFYLQGELFDNLDKDFYIRLATDGKLEYEFVDFKINKDHAITRPREVAGFASETIEVDPKYYYLYLEIEGQESIRLPDFEAKLGGSYVATITPNHTILGELDPKDASSYVVGIHAIVEPSSMHMFWLLPQYIIITMGEIMFSVTGLEFSYSQSPVSMKSVLQASWLLTVAFGNLIVVIIAEAKFFQEQSKEFFLFAGLMFVDMIIFAFMAWRYIPAQLEDPNAVKAVEGEEKPGKED